MPSRMYTIETRLPGKSELVEYLNKYVPDYSEITRRVWQDMTSPDFMGRYPKMSEYVSHICAEYRLLKRTVNSIRYDVQGRMKALMELKKAELAQVHIKIVTKEDKISGIRKELDELKPKASANILTEKQLEHYCSLKQSLYWQQNKLNRLMQRKKNLEYQIGHKVYRMCYGSKKEFSRQYNLADNGYKTHEKWHNDFVKARDKNIFFLGSADESFGNQLCRLQYDEKTGLFRLDVRKEYRYCKSNKICDKYVSLDSLDFRYRKNDLLSVLKTYDTAGNGSYPLSYRFHRIKNRWYLQVIFARSFGTYRTTSEYGVIGLDYNDGFIELSETDESGNLIFQKHYGLKYHGTGRKAESEIRETVSDIVQYAECRCKDVVIENLEFNRTKAKRSRAKKAAGKSYNRMLHLFDYSRYKQTLQNAGFAHRVRITMVSPKNTSKIGRQKYAGNRKMTVHQAASYVIARRGQGYIDILAV